jgi:hypothetical protein
MPDTSKLRSPEQWFAFLDTAARLHKYTFEEQLLIHRRRPNATACAQSRIWEKRMRRTVRDGAVGIPLPGKDGRVVYDIADTLPQDGAKEPFDWRLTPDEREIAEAAIRKSLNVGGHDLGSTLYEAAQKISSDEALDKSKELCQHIGRTKLENLPQEDIVAAYRAALTQTTAYILHRRVGLRGGDFKTDECYKAVARFSTSDALTTMATLASKNAKDILKHIQDEIDIERGKNHDEQRLRRVGAVLGDVGEERGRDTGEARPDGGGFRAGSQVAAEEVESVGRGLPSGQRIHAERILTTAEPPERGGFLSAEELRTILRDGGNQRKSNYRIIARFSKNLSDNVEFLKKEYKYGGKGFQFGDKQVAVWWDERGMSIERGTAASMSATRVTWEQAASVIREMLDDGVYASRDVLDSAIPNERISRKRTAACTNTQCAEWLRRHAAPRP